MPHEGYADPITNDGPGFHSDMPVSELTEHVTRAIEISDVSSAPSVVETTDGVTTTKTSQPSTGPPLRAGARGKLDSQGDRMRGGRTMAQILGRGTHENNRRFLVLLSLSSPRSLVTPDPSNGKGSGVTR